ALRRLFVQDELEARGELHGAQRTKAVVAERLRVDGAKQMTLQIVTAIERIHVLVRQRIPRNCVDGEVAPASGLLQRHEGIPSHLEALMATSLLRLTPGNGDIDRAAVLANDFVDREALADRLHAPERCEQPGKLLDWNAEDLQVDVLGVRDSGLGIRDALHETVTHPTADDECAAAGVTHAGSERCDECWSCSTVHDSNYPGSGTRDSGFKF